MIVNKKDRSEVSSNVKDSVFFGIKKEGFSHIFNVLRNQLYSDKELAVVRELLGTINSKKCLKEELISTNEDFSIRIARQTPHPTYEYNYVTINNQNNLYLIL